MALPSVAQGGLLPTEVEYIASTESTVSILPLVSVDRVRLLSGTFGPFRPPAHAEVPVWLAIHLRRKQKCVIIPPEWMAVDALAESVRLETTQPAFAPMPLHYVALSKLLLEQCVLLRDPADAQRGTGHSERIAGACAAQRPARGAAKQGASGARHDQSRTPRGACGGSDGADHR